MKPLARTLSGFALGVLLLPSLALASVSAGFPSGSIWLSKISLTEGDSVQIFTALYNAGTAKITGDSVFSVDGVQIGSVHFELAGGEAKIASLSWNAKQGPHAISAEIQNATDSATKEPLVLSKEKTEAITITVSAPPPPNAALKLLSDATSAISGAVTVSLPAVTSAVQSVFGVAENVRTQAVTALETSLAKESENGKSAGDVLGASIFKDPNLNSATVATAPSSFSLLQTLKQGALFIANSQWLFYPLLLLILLGMLYSAGRALSRPKPRGQV